MEIIIEPIKYSEEFSDIQVTIQENQDKIMTLKLHRIILASKSIYFKSMFEFQSVQLLGSSEQKITIYVENIQVMYDVIMSFYDKPIDIKDKNWEYILKLFRCKSFLGVDNNPTLLYEISVPKEHFEALLDILNEFDVVNDINLLRIVKKNIPEDYKIANFSVDFLIELKKIKPFKVLMIGEKGIVKFNKNMSKNLFIPSNIIKHKNNLFFSPDKTKIITKRHGKIKFWDVRTGTLLKILKSTEIIGNITVSPNNKHIITKYCDVIKIWDVEKESVIHVIKDTSPYYYYKQALTFSPCGNTFVTDGYQSIKLWNVHDGTLRNIIDGFNFNILKMNFSNDGSKIMIFDRAGFVFIWNFDANILQKYDFDINMLNRSKNCVSSEIAFSNNIDKLALGYSNGDISMHDITSKKTHYLKNHKNHVRNVGFSPDDKKLISLSDEGIVNVWDIENLTSMEMGFRDGVKIADFIYSNKNIDAKIDEFIYETKLNCVN